MTKTQELILRYLNTQNFEGSTKAVGDYIVEVTDQSGTVKRLTMNLFCDIMDADTQEVVAESDAPHSMDKLARNLYQVPKSWTAAVSRPR